MKSRQSTSATAQTIALAALLTSGVASAQIGQSCWSYTAAANAFGHVTAHLSDGRILASDINYSLNKGMVRVYTVGKATHDFQLASPFPVNNGKYGHSLRGFGNFDGQPGSEFGVGEFATNSVYIYDGNGTLKNTLPGGPGFGIQFMAIPDLNNDGFPELVVSESVANPAGTGQGKVYLYSSAGVAFSYSFPDFLGPFVGSFGWDIDFAFDGSTPRILVGTPYEKVGTMVTGRAHSYQIYPAARGQRCTWNKLVHRTYKSNFPAHLEEFGHSVAFIDNANSSGSPTDVAIGVRNRKRVDVFDGIPGWTIGQFYGVYAQTGFNMRTLADTDGDGKSDLLVGSSTSSLYVLSGKTVGVTIPMITQIAAGSPGAAFDVYRSSRGNLISIGAVGNPTSSVCRLFLADYVELGGGCAPSFMAAPKLAMSARPIVNTTPVLSFTVPFGYPNPTTCFLAVGFTPLAPVQLFCGDFWITNMIGAPIPFTAVPNVPWTLNVPIVSANIGIPLVVQGAAGVPTGTSLSNSMTLNPGKY